MGRTGTETRPTPTTRHPVTTARRRTGRRRRVRLLLLLLPLLPVLGGGLLLGLLVAAIYWDARHDETAPADAIVVLGAAQWNGRPSHALQARLDHALQLYREGYAPVIVLTGGVGTGDRYSEAEVGAAYLQAQGVPADAMLTVGGRTSLESLREASALLLARGERRVLVVSDPFHMFRVKRMASDLGLSPLASPTQTSPIRPGTELERRYILREVAAYLAYVFVRQ